ncbi:MAG: hypothetical protein HY074_07885 [Deltaproteobacteria bacterium]|nr:hypothetical protein [Deltaproteobacteria bacterium]
MEARIKIRKLLGEISTPELWCELARRIGVRFGKIQMAIHDGRPSKFATLDMKICTEDDKKSGCLVQHERAE